MFISANQLTNLWGQAVQSVRGRPAVRVEGCCGLGQSSHLTLAAFQLTEDTLPVTEDVPSLKAS